MNFVPIQGLFSRLVKKIISNNLCFSQFLVFDTFQENYSFD
jgi:hypothetical protein